MEDLQGNVSTEEVVSTPQVEEVATPELDVTNTYQDESEEVVDPQSEEVKQVQSAEENSRYAKLRREAEERARDKTIAEMQMEWNGQPINTYAEYQRALKEQKLMQEAEQQGLDPQFYSEFKLMQEELNGYKQEKNFMEQDKALASDPVKGQFYGQWKDDIREMATTYGVDLNTAFTLTLEAKLPEILSGQAQKIQNETIQKINQNKSSSVGSLSQQGENPSLDIWDMSNSDFSKMVEKAKNGGFKKY